MQIFVLGILAGVYIGFGAFLMMQVGGNCPGLATTNPGLKAIISGLFGLPCGLLMVLITGAELFSGNAALVVSAWLEKKATFQQLCKSWFFSYAGNFVGSILLAAIAAYSGLLDLSPVATNLAVAKTNLAWGPVR
jgi:formate transporter